MGAIDKAAPIKERRIKHISQKWFDGEISEAIKNRDKYWKNLKDLDDISMRNCIMRLNIRCITWFSIRKKDYFENKLNKCIGKEKELWKALKSLGLPNKISSCEMNALKVNKTVQMTKT